MKKQKSKQMLAAKKSLLGAQKWRKMAALPVLMMMTPAAVPAFGQETAGVARPGAASGPRSFIHTSLATPVHYQGNVSVSDNSSGSAAAGTANTSSLNLGSITGLATTRALDLGSVAANVVLNSNLFGTAQSVSLNIGGNPQTFVPGQLVTAGIFVAAKQVLQSGTQSLNLTQTGTATGGTFSLNSVISPRVSEIVIPSGVSALSISNNHNAFRATDITNYGSIYVAPQAVTGNSALLSASDIKNLPTGLITSDFSSGAFSAMGYGSSINLMVHALNNITNYGSISSSGSLSLTTTNGAISNITAPGSQQAAMSAATDISMFSGNGYIVNSGLVQAMAGNINLATANTLTDLNVLASTGTFKALMGDVNIRDAAYNAAANINMTGGDYLSKTLNIFAGTGAITGDVGELTGCLNTSGNAAHFIASTPLLHLGNNSIKGDPLYVNTAGSISISGLMDVSAANEPLAIVASGDITGDATAQIVNHSGNVVLIAGAKISSYSGSTQFPGKADGTLTINNVASSSASGGKIDFSASTAGTIIDTSSVLSKGGSVTLLSHGGGSSSGEILFPSNSISINSSSDTNNAGAVTVISDSSSGSGISMGTIYSASQLKGGDVGLYTQSAANSTVSFDPTGAMTGSILPSGTNAGNQNILVGSIITAGGGGVSATAAGEAGGSAGSITLTASQVISVNGSLLAFGGGGAGGAGTAVLNQVNTGGAGGAGNTINVSAGSNIQITGDLNSSGGGGGGGGADGTTGSGASGGIGGSAGAVTVLSGTGDVTVGGSIYAAAGGDGGNGGIFGGTVAGGGGGGGSFGGGGGAGGGTAAVVAGAGGGGGAGYTVLSGPYSINASGGGGAGGSGVGVTNNGGGGGGIFGPGQGGFTSDLLSITGNGGNGGTGKGPVLLPGLSPGGDGGVSLGSSLSPGLGGIFFPIPGGSLYGLNSPSGGLGGGTGGGGQASVQGQNVKLTTGSGGNIYVQGGSVSIGATADLLPAASIPVTVYGNNVLLASTSSSLTATGLTLGQATTKANGINLGSTGSSLTLISATDISFSTITARGQNTDFTLLAGVNISNSKVGNLVVDLASSSTRGGSIVPTTASIFSFDILTNGGKFTEVAMSNGTKGGVISLGFLNTSGVSKSGNVLLLANHQSTSFDPFSNVDPAISAAQVVSGGVASGNIGIFAQAPAANKLTINSSGNVGGTITNSGIKLSDTSLSLGSLTSSGVGGVSLPNANATDGTNAGNIDIEANYVQASGSIYATGGGGGGGYGGQLTGFDGGKGGNGGNITIDSAGLTFGAVPGIAVGNGAITTSGGGGGGGGGGFNSGGAGGAGGKAGAITIKANGTVKNYPAMGDTSKGFISPGADLFAMDGGAGGAGGSGSGITSGGGGGGGAAFGGNAGGGGGAGSSTGSLVINGLGGGGGAAGGTFTKGFFSSTGFNGYAGGGGGGGGTSLTPSGGGSGAGLTPVNAQTNIQSSLFSYGIGGSSGNDSTPGAAGGDGSDTGGGTGGTHGGFLAAAGGSNTLGTAGTGGGQGVPVYLFPGTNGSSAPFTSGNNGKISINADTVLLPASLPFTTTAIPSIFGGDVDAQVGDLIGTPSALTYTALWITIATNTATLSTTDGLTASYLAFHTPMLNVQITGSSNPLERTLLTPTGLAAPTAFMSGINDSSPVVLNLTSNVDVTISGTGPVQLGNITAPSFKTTVTSAPLGGFFAGGTPDPDAKIAGSITILSGSKINANTVSLVAFDTTKAQATISQQDPLTQFPITTSTLQLGIGSFPGGLGGGISVAAQSNTGNIDLTANNPTGPVQLATSGSTSLVNSSINYLGSDLPKTNNAATFSLFTSADVNGNSAITIGAGSTLTANTVFLTTNSSGTGNGAISQIDPLTTPSIIAKSINLTTMGTSTATDANNIDIGANSPNNLPLVKINSTGNVHFADLSGKVSLTNSHADGNFTLDLANILTTVGNLSVGGDIVINGAGVENYYYISGSSVTINGSAPSPSQLMIRNGGDGITTGVIEATGNGGNITINSELDLDIYVESGLQPNGLLKVSGTGNPQIIFNLRSKSSVANNTVGFLGNQNFDGPTIMNAQGVNQSVSVLDGVTAKGNALVWLKTPTYSQLGKGTGQILGNPLVFGTAGNAGTIANSGGDVNLPSNLLFLGSDLAILASQNINSTGLTAINLSGPFAGSLTLVAGYNFNPPTAGQVGPNSTSYIIGNPSSGGSINLSGATITLNSVAVTGGAAGNLTAVAHGGSVSLGNIDVSASANKGIAGSVTIIGQNGINVGSIKSTGQFPGAINLSASDSQTLGTTVIAGNILTGGFANVPGTFNNNIALAGTINAGSANVTITTGNAGAITSTPGVVINAGQVTLTSGSGGIGTIGTAISTNTAALSANSIGDVYLATSTKAVNLGASSGNVFQLTSTSNGATINLVGALAADDVSLKSNANGSFVLSAPIGGINGGDAQKVVINMNGTGSLSDLYQGAPSISASSLQLSSGTGSFGSATNPLQVNASTLKASTNNILVGGGVYINDINTGPVTINGLSSGTSNSSVTYTGAASTLNISGQVSGNTINIDNQGAINVNNKIVGTGAVAVTAAGVINTSSTIDGQSITIGTSAGSAGSITLGGPLTSSGPILVTSGGNITTTSTLSGSIISLSNVGSNGFISIGGTITGTGLVSLQAKGNLSSISSIAGKGIAIQTSAGSSGSIDLGGTLTSSADLSILSDSGITTSGSISGVNVTVTNTGTSGTAKIGGPVTGSGAVNISSKGALTTASTINGGTVNLSTAPGTSGSIQVDGTITSNGALVISSDNSVSTTGSVQSSNGTILIQNQGSSGGITLGGPLLANNGSITVSSKGNLSSSSNITGNGIALSTAKGLSGSITLGGTISSGAAVSIASDNSISTSGSISGSTVDIKNTGTSGGAKIGGPIVSTGTLTVTGRGALDITGDLSGSLITVSTAKGTSGSVLLGGTIKATGVVDISSDGNISTTGSITGSVVTIQNSGTSGSAKIAGPVVSSGALTITGRGPLDIIGDLSGSVIKASTAAGTGGSVQLSGTIKSTGLVSVSSDSTINTTGSISGSNILLVNAGATGGSSIGGPLAATSSLTINTKGNLSVSSDLSGNQITLSTGTGSSGSIQLGGTTKSTGTVDISSDNSIITTGTISGTNVTLANTGSNGGTTIGGAISSTGPLSISTKGNLIANSDLNGSSITLSTGAGSSGFVQLSGTTKSTGLLSISSDNTISTTGTVSGATIQIQNTGASGGTSIEGPLTGTGAVTIASKGNLLVTSDLTGDSLDLSTAAGTSGSITLGGTTKSTNGITLKSDNKILTSGNLTAGDIISLQSGGDTTIGGSISSTKLVSVTSAGTLTVNSSISGSPINLQTAKGSSSSIFIAGSLTSATGDVKVSSDNSITTSSTITGVNVTLDNVGTSGSVTVGGTVNSSGLVSINSKGTLKINTPVSSSGVVNLNAQGNIDINGAVTGSNVSLVTLAGSNGNITLSANISASDSISADAGVILSADGVGSITQTTGVVSTAGSAVTVTTKSGIIGSATNPITILSPTIGANTSGNVFVLALSPLTTLTSSTGNSFNLTTTGDLSIPGSAGISANFVNLSTLNNGNIILNGKISGTGVGTNALSVSLSLSGTGTTQGLGSISTNDLTLTAVTGDFGSTILPLNTNAQTIKANTQGSLAINDTGAGATTLLASTGDDLTLQATKVVIGGASNFAGTASFLTSDFTNPAGTTFTAGNINIDGMSFNPLTIKNGGTLVATAPSGTIRIVSANDQNLFIGNAGGPTPGAMQVTGGGLSEIDLIALGTNSASSNSIIFTGNQNFFGNTVMDASIGLNQVVQVNSGVTIQGFQAVTVLSNDLILNGTLIGNPLIFNSPSGAGTIANSQGDVLLASNLIFQGQSLAIIASNNVLVTNPSGILIDLSNSSSTTNLGKGGTLSVLAGFNFNPATGGQVGPTGAVYAIGNNPNAAGGSISLGSATIKTGTSVDGSNSGNVLAAAHAGSQNDGSVTLGSIDTSNTGKGGSAGSITVVAQGGATLGAINSTGSTDGAVSVSSATPQIIGTISDQNGNFAGGGFVQATPTTFSGNIVLSSISAGKASVSATTGASGNISVNDGSTISSGSVTFTEGSGGGVAIGKTTTVKADTINISAGALGVLQGDNNAILDTPVLVISTAGGDIGSKTQPINSTATTLTASASGTASVYLYDSATTDISLVNSGALTNASGNIYSLVSLNPSGTNTKSGGGAQINAAHVQVESLNGNLNVAVNSAIANSIDFKALNGNIALSSSAISVVADSKGNGGSISLNSATLTYTGSGLSPLQLSANATGTGNGGQVSFITSDSTTLSIGKSAGNIIINATGGSIGSNAGNGGTAVVSTGGSLNFDPSQLNIVPLGNNGDGGKLSLIAGTVQNNSTLSINTNSITENGVGIGNGGSVQLNAPTVSYQNSGTLPLTLTANGGKSGNGGVISFITTNTSLLTVGSGSNSLNIAASSGTTGGNGGTVTVSTGGAMTVAPENISAGPLGSTGNGATINLLAGNNAANSPLIVNGNLSAAAKGSAVGGTLNLQANSTDAFVILQKNFPATNGTYGVLSVAGNAGNGNIFVKNISGGITLSTTVRGPANNPALNSVNNLSFEAGAGDIVINSSIGKTTTSSISLKAAANITKAAGALLTSNKLTLVATTGSIGTTTTAFKTTSNVLSVTAGQIVNLANTSTALSLGTSQASATGTFTLTNTGSITTTGDISAGSVKMSSGANGNIAIGGNIKALAPTGSATLIANGKGSIFNQFASGLDRITANSIVLQSSSGSIGLVGTSPVALRVTSGAITPTTSGSVNIDNASTAPLTIAGSASTSEVRLITQGNLTISKPITAKAISLATGNNGNIAINANLGGLNTTVVTVNAGGSGNISTAKNTNILSGTQSITLISGTGNIGSGTVSTTAITTKTPLLSANTSGTGVVNLSDSVNGTLASSSSGGSFTLAGTGTLTIGKLSTTNGDINITAKGATLQTSAGSTITANNGSLTLNNTNTAGKIIIGTNSTVQTQGVGGKDVKIVVGPIPAVGTNPPSAPANVVVSTSGGGNVFFGTNGITGPTTTPVAHVNAIGKNVIFSTNKAKASAITLGSGSTITADPPVVGGLVIRSAEFYAETQSTDSAARANAKAIGVVSPTNRGSLTELAAKNDSSSATYAIAAAASAPLQVNIAAFDSINPQAAQSYVATQNVVTNSTSSEGSAPDSSGYTYRSSSNLDSVSNRIVPAHLITDIASEGELTMTTATKSAKPNSMNNAISNILSGGVTKVSMPTCFNMKGESILFAPKQNMTVKTDMATIKVDAGSVVLVMEHGDGITVFNFDDAHRGAVEIVFEGKRIGVAPGRHCSLSYRSEFSEMNPAQTIPHRNMIVSKTTDGKVIFESEFSLPAAFDRVGPISSLMVSKHPHAKKLVGHMLKTAAVISQLNRSGVGFKQYTKPSITAFVGN